MNREDLKLLADTRVADAEALLQANRWAAAYYLLGYAVECALKACAAHQFRQDEVPDKKVVTQFYTHDLKQLLEISGMKSALNDKIKSDPDFQDNWKTVSNWNEDSRYRHSTSDNMARDMRVAVADPSHGVLPWLKTQW